MGDEIEPSEPSPREEADFRRRLKKARSSHAEKHVERPSSNHGLALRIGSDFVAGIVVGGIFGWSIDNWLGSSPWGLIICLSLGFATGTHLAIRSAKEINERGSQGSDN